MTGNYTSQSNNLIGFLESEASLQSNPWPLRGDLSVFVIEICHCGNRHRVP